MLEILNGEVLEPSAPVKPFHYLQRRKFLGWLIPPLTRWLRTTHAQKYMEPAQRHLDIGCGDGYFLKRSRCKECYGIDKHFGDDLKDTLDFPDNHFDYVTLLAVIEHLHNPERLIKEIARVLKPKGKLIITTPKKISDKIIKMYAREIDEEHVGYYHLDSIKNLTKAYFILKGYHTFIFRLNQAFCLEKKQTL